MLVAEIFLDDLCGYIEKPRYVRSQKKIQENLPA